MSDSAKSLLKTRLVDKTERACPKDFADAVGVLSSRGSDSRNAIVDDISE